MPLPSFQNERLVGCSAQSKGRTVLKRDAALGLIGSSSSSERHEYRPVMASVATGRGASSHMMHKQAKMTSVQIEAVSGRLVTANVARLCMDKASQLLGQIKRTTYWNGISSGKRAAKKFRRRSKTTGQQQQEPRRRCDLQNIQGFQAKVMGGGRIERPACVLAEATRPVQPSIPPTGSRDLRWQGRVMGKHGQAWEALGSNPPFA